MKNGLPLNQKFKTVKTTLREERGAIAQFNRLRKKKKTRNPLFWLMLKILLQLVYVYTLNYKKLAKTAMLKYIPN